MKKALKLPLFGVLSLSLALGVVVAASARKSMSMWML